MEYQYLATTKDGQLTRGTIEAGDRETVRDILRRQKLMIVSIHSRGEKPAREKTLFGRSFGLGKSSLLDKIVFARHLSIMLRSGMSLGEALSGLEDQVNSKKMKQIISSILRSVNNGQTLAAGLEQYPREFPGIFIGMVKVGEASGTLERNLDYISSELEKDYQLTRKVKSAMIYPAIVLSATLALGIGLSIFILPRLVEMFNTFRLELPVVTRIFLFAAGFLVDFGVYILVLLFSAAIVLRLLAKSKRFSPYFHRFYLKLPVLKKLMKNLNLARMSRALSILLKSGVTITDSLNIAAIAAGNDVYRNELIAASQRIKRGQPLAAALRHPEYIPAMVNKMINVGEKTGKLEETLGYLADFYEEEVDNATKNLSTVLEPILLVIIGVILGFLAVAIISPIYQFTGSLQR